MDDELELIAEIEASGDDTTAGNIRQTGSSSNKAVTDLVQPIAAEIIASDATVIAAASSAVGTALDISPRIPKLGDPGAFEIVDKEGTVALAVTSSGSIYAPTLQSSAFRPLQVVCLYGGGQSNLEARARQYGILLDPVDPNILMWNWPTGTLTTATVPLSSQQEQSGLSVLTVMAREGLKESPAGTVFVVVNAGVGGSPLVGSNANGTWNPGSSATPNLYNIFLNTITSVRQAIAARFPGVPVTEIMAWVQGEADTTRDQYATVWDQLCDGVRTHTGNPNLPIVVGGIVPEYIVLQPSRALVREAHIGIPARKMYTAYQDGIPNGGGSGSVTDIVHYAREGAIRLGKGMWRAIARAYSNNAASVPVPPQDLAATRANGKIIATWSPPFCRVTGYRVEFSVDDGATWTFVAGRPIPLDTTTLLTNTAASVLIRVATINDNGTSAFTTPARVIGV